ncbi:MAG: crossover junction endodeoxyribonuclease RuvC [Sedimentisphaerales bacterium]
MQRILGIDPGSRITGFGLIDSDGVRSIHIAHGILRLEGEALPPRLGEIFARISELIERHRPEVMAIEQVFVAKNPASALKLGQARGAAICAAMQHGLSVAEYTPTRIKQSVMGTGRADKGQIQHMRGCPGFRFGNVVGSAILWLLRLENNVPLIVRGEIEEVRGTVIPF